MTGESIKPANETERLAVLRRYNIVDAALDSGFDRITGLAARIFDVPIAIIGIADNDRIWFKSHQGIELEQVEREPGESVSAILQDRPLVVTDAQLDPRARANPLARAVLGLRFYAGVPLRTSDGHTLGTLCVVDTKPRQVSEQELAALESLAAIVVDELDLRSAARDEEQRLSQERAEFIVTASHELRTPLAAVYGAAKLLSKPVTDDRSRDKLIALIAEESERLATVVGEILTGAQLEAGQIEIVRGRFDPVEVVGAAAAAARLNLPQNLSLALDAAAHLPEIESDVGKVRQILAGLIDNAVKYSPEGGQIDVAIEPRNGGVRFRVSDEGIGIPEQDRERVFGRFIRLNRDLTRNVGGTGLGLYIARELARELGGSLACPPHPGTGTTFILDLPAHPPSVDHPT